MEDIKEIKLPTKNNPCVNCLWCDTCYNFCNHEIIFNSMNLFSVEYVKRCSLCNHTGEVTVQLPTWEEITKHWHRT